MISDRLTLLNSLSKVRRAGDRLTLQQHFSKVVHAPPDLEEIIPISARLVTSDRLTLRPVHGARVSTCPKNWTSLAAHHREKSYSNI